MFSQKNSFSQSRFFSWGYIVNLSQIIQDYYPFGSPMVGRGWEAGNNDSYRFGFNGKEMDDEVSVDGGHIAFEARIYDSRICRFLSCDPREGEYPWQTTFAYLSNSPICITDYLGGGAWHPEDDGSGTGTEKLVADAGDIDETTGKIDQTRLRDYLNTVGVEHSDADFYTWVGDAEETFRKTGNTSDIALTSTTQQFDNMIGKFLVNKATIDPSWGATNYDGPNCSPTTFNRVDKAIEYIYGRDYLGRSSVANPRYNAWQGNTTTGYTSQQLYSTGVGIRVGIGSSVSMSNTTNGGLKPGAVLELYQTYYDEEARRTKTSSHSAIFLNYTYSGGAITGMSYWQQGPNYTTTINFRFNNHGHYTFMLGYKPYKGLNFN